MNNVHNIAQEENTQKWLFAENIVYIYMYIYIIYIYMHAWNCVCYDVTVWRRAALQTKFHSIYHFEIKLVLNEMLWGEHSRYIIKWDFIIT